MFGRDRGPRIRDSARGAAHAIDDLNTPSDLDPDPHPLGRLRRHRSTSNGPPTGRGRRSRVRPDLAGPLDDYPAALAEALDAPLGMTRLGEGLGPGSTVAIVVDDPSRWTPVREALPIILRRLHDAGVRESDIAISAGVGRHHPVDAEAMRKRVGDAIPEVYACYSPPVDDLAEYEDLGTTADGVPVRVFRPVARADVRVLIGSVLPHLQAGFGGGYKLIFPGTSHRSTLGVIHSKGLGAADAGRLLGSDADANPMRRAIRAAAERLGPCVSISHLLGSPGQVFRVRSGHPDAVQDDLAAEVRRRYCAPESPTADLVVAGNHPWPGDPMQSFKVLLQHRAAGRPGSVLVGFFWTDPAEIARSFPNGPDAGDRGLGRGVRRLEFIRRGLAAADRVASFDLARSERVPDPGWARELVVDRTVLVYAPPLHERIGGRLGPVRVFADQATRSGGPRGTPCGASNAPPPGSSRRAG